MPRTPEIDAFQFAGMLADLTGDKLKAGGDLYVDVRPFQDVEGLTIPPYGFMVRVGGTEDRCAVFRVTVESTPGVPVPDDDSITGPTTSDRHQGL